MSTRKLLLTALVMVVLLGVGAFTAKRFGTQLYVSDIEAGRGLSDFPLPVRETDRLFDVGVVDANGDGFLDLYTSNHHFRQVLLLADGKGNYRDVLSEWGLDQSRSFPLAELSFIAPVPDKAGIYVYWLGTDFVVRAHRVKEIGHSRGSLSLFSSVEVMKAERITADKRETRIGEVTETRIDFTIENDGMLVLRPGGQGVPLDFSFDGAIEPASIFVGLARIAPGARSFSLAMQDRHAFAWADFNGDGVLDVFVNRGALSGTLRAYPAKVASVIRDELFLSRAPGAFEERGAETGLEKAGCSGRHANWVDFDGDGLLDLFVNCYDREHFAGDYPKQLYRQSPAGKLTDVAGDVGLGLPDQQMANIAWLDVDGDGSVDLLAFQEEGLFLYRQVDRRFVREPVLERPTKGERRIGQGRGNYWFYDGKFAALDYDGDGDIDVFSSSKRGNVLLRNDHGKLVVANLAAAGLPPTSSAASWVDLDNDGLPDLHLVPQGIYRQRPDHSFEATGLLAVPADRYDAAIVNWLDFDNDGRLDVLLALDENPEFRRWWDFGREPKKRGRWRLVALRNTHPGGNWLQVELLGDAGNRQGIGAAVLVSAGGVTRSQVVGASEGSFFSQGHYRLYFGLGLHKKADAVKVRWPDGLEQELKDIAADRLLRIERPAGVRPPGNR